MKKRLALVLSATALVVAAPATAATEDFIPFVTDFPTVAPPTQPAAQTGTSGIEWAEVAVGGGAGAALAALLGGGLVLTRRVRPAER